MVYVVWTGFVRMHLRDFELAGEERGVAARQFISHLDREIDRAGVSGSFVLAERIAAAAIFDLPPVTCAGLLCFAIKLPRATPGRRELCINLAAAGDWSIDAQVQFGHPTKDLKIFFVRTERESRDLNRVFSNRRLVLGSRVPGGEERNEQS